MEQYELTRTSLSSNKWKAEGALIAVLGLALLVWVVLAGGALLSVLFFGTIIVLGWQLYNNDKIVRVGWNETPQYLQQGDTQSLQWQQRDEWETQRQWNPREQQWQNQNIQRRQRE